MLKEIQLTTNRELSWLKFNARVLQEAASVSVPLIERLRFLGIYSNNLDEFYKVRYAGVRRLIQLGNEAEDAYDELTPSQLLKKINKLVLQQEREYNKVYTKIAKELKQKRVHLINEKEILPLHKPYLENYFNQKVSPALNVLLLKENQDFPDLKDGALYLVVRLQQKNLKPTYALIEVPSKIIPRFIILPQLGREKYILFLEDLIRLFLNKIFYIFEYDQIEAHAVKITRDAELSLDNDLKYSFLEKISNSLKQRKHGDAVRFVYDANIAHDTLTFITQKMGVETNYDSIIPGGKYHNRKDYIKFPNILRKTAEYNKITPIAVKGLEEGKSMLTQIKKRDYLIQPPYNNFGYFIRFLREAAIDPKVTHIYMSIYRVADDSKVMNALINGAKNGIKVTVIVELQARFDEAANVKWAKKLEQEGLNVIFGIKGLKVHSKICMIERLDNHKTERYSAVSTGNFNESTAKTYIDDLLFTAHKDINFEISKLFEFIQYNYRLYDYKHLVVSPHGTRKKFHELIDNEINHSKNGKKGFIHLRMNSLVDKKLIHHLYEASQAGVKIKLLVRGINCLIVGKKDLSENIEAISIVDKFLEHSRVYWFHNNGDDHLYLSSADWMPRNLDHRVEATCPIYDKDIRKRLMNNFTLYWKDNTKARVFNEKQDNKYIQNKEKKYRAQFDIYDYFKTYEKKR